MTSPHPPSSSPITAIPQGPQEESIIPGHCSGQYNVQLSQTDRRRAAKDCVTDRETVCSTASILPSALLSVLRIHLIFIADRNRDTWRGTAYIAGRMTEQSVFHFLQKQDIITFCMTSRVLAATTNGCYWFLSQGEADGVRSLSLTSI